MRTLLVFEFPTPAGAQDFAEHADIVIAAKVALDVVMVTETYDVECCRDDAKRLGANEVWP